LKTIETARLILRELTQDDFDAVHSYASDFDNLIYMQFGPNTKDKTQAFFDIAFGRYKASPMTEYTYAVELKKTGKLIGSCEFHLSGDCKAEIGWIIHSDHWNKGYGTEMGKRLLELGFDELNQHRIVARCDTENIGSYRIMEKLGMRREGLFFDARPPHKQSTRQFGDEFRYAILKSEWEMQKEIAYYNSLPYEFNGFVDVPTLTNGEIYLVCTAKQPGDPIKNWIPGYNFAICKNGEKVGDISFRIGYGGGPKNDNLYYGGQIGYNVNEEFRGNGYAAEACRLLLPIAHAHKMTKLLITNNVTNAASRRVCEKLGAKLIRAARLPEYNDLYKEGQRFSNIFEWSL